MPPIGPKFNRGLERWVCVDGSYRVLFETVNPSPERRPDLQTERRPTPCRSCGLIATAGAHSIFSGGPGSVVGPRTSRLARAASTRWPRRSRRSPPSVMPSRDGSVASCRSTPFTNGRRGPPASSLTRSWARTAYRSPWRACGNAGRIGEREVNPDELRWMVLRPYLAGLMRAYPVGVRVGNVRNNDAALLDEISLAA